MVPMEARHVLLGRPWQYDRDIVHNGVTNLYSFLHKGKKVVLSPLSPSEVCEDQIKMRLKREKEKKIKVRKSPLREKNQKEKENKKSEKQLVIKESLFIKPKEVKKVMLARQPMYLLIPNNKCLPSSALELP